jgi:ribose transport system ATP-binding protein
MVEFATRLLEVRKISKSFPGVKALRDVNLHLDRGEVLAVIGENGAGKSTLMKILAGVQLPDQGEVLVDGRPVMLDSVRAAMQVGIGLIHQELNLADNLSVGANVFLGREPRRFGFIDQAAIRRRTREILDQVGLSLSPDEPLRKLTIGKQQMVEIAKALSFDARVLIMDEPTSSLSSHETEQLLRLVKDLRARGIGIIYISHRLGEVKELADRVTVLRDGANAGDLDRNAISHDAMVRMMVGRDISQFYGRKAHPIGDEVLSVEKLSTTAWPQHANSFSLRRGEIVGVAGLVGAGRTEMLRALFGVDRRTGGRFRWKGKDVSFAGPREAMALGMALVPEDRKQQGLVVEMPVRENMTLASLDQHRRFGSFIDRQYEKSQTRTMIDRLRIKTPHDRQPARFLSGGNQQKIVLGKWLARKPDLLLLDEPTRGIDIGAKQEIYRLMEELAAEGMAILFVSSEMEEVIGMSDRVLVFHEGKLTGQLPRERLTEQSIMALATGQVE